MRLTKKLATLAMRSIGDLGARPRRAILEPFDERARDRLVHVAPEQQRDVDVDAVGRQRAAPPGRPAPVPGTLIIRLGRATTSHRWRASATVAFVSFATPGETSTLT